MTALIDHRHRMWKEIGGRTEEELLRHDRAYAAWLAPLLRRGEVVGVAVLGPGHSWRASGLIWFRPDQPRPGISSDLAGYILSMYTAREHRRKGLARLILRRLMAEARRRRVGRLSLHAAPQGRRLYGSLGFVRTWEMRLNGDVGRRRPKRAVTGRPPPRRRSGARGTRRR